MRRVSGLFKRLREMERAVTNLRVKVCGMRDPANIALIAECAPDYMGFIFVPSSLRFVANTLRPEITRALPPSITTVGVFQNEELGTVTRLSSHYGLRAVQLHGEEDSRYARELRATLPGIQILKAVSVRSATDVTNQNTISDVDVIIFDNGKGGSGETFNWAFLSEYRGETPFLVAGGIGTDNIVALRDKGESWRRFLGVDVNSKVEESPGVKSVIKVRALIAKAAGYDS
jgi:phosphoribosylanthranilate isomerase